MKKEDLVVGQKYVVTYGMTYPTGSYYHEFNVGDVVECISLKGGFCGNPEFRNFKGKTQFLKLEQVEPHDSLTGLKTAYDNAKTAYETAVRAEQEAIKAAEAKAKEALKFTEDDVKNLMVVEHSSSKDMLRLVVISGDAVTFYDSKGKETNLCNRKTLVHELNMLYKQTTKTLKDFANA